MTKTVLDFHFQNTKLKSYPERYQMFFIEEFPSQVIGESIDCNKCSASVKVACDFCTFQFQYCNKTKRIKIFSKKNPDGKILEG